MSQLTPDVLVMGAGPIGVPLAIGLKRQGLSVLLIEKQKQPQKVFKGEYLQPAATHTLKKLGLQKVFSQPSCEFIKELRFRDLDENGDIQSELLMEYPKGSHATSITHFELITALREHAKEELQDSFLPGVHIQPVNGESSKFFSNPQFSFTDASGAEVRISPRWVVGCDGRASTVRKWLGGKPLPANAPVTTGADPELIIGAEIVTPPPMPQRYEVIRFFEKGTLSSFSLGEHGQRLYYSHPDAQGNVTKECRNKVQELANELKPMIDLGQVEDRSPVFAFPAYGMWFGSVAQGSIILAGDAAGVTSPYGGQGMTAAMEHVSYLLEHFDFKSDPSSLEGERQTRVYAGQVRKIHDRISLLNLGLYYLFFSRVPFVKTLSSYVISVWEENPDLKERVVRLFAGIDRDKPTVLELMRLWGITKSPIRRSLSQLRSFRFGA